MKPRRLWKISATTTSEAEEAVAELLQNVFAQPPSSYADQRTGAITVSVYLKARPDWPAKRARILRGLARARRCGLRIGSARISARRLPREDWAESWKRHFKAFNVGRVLLVKPGWIRRRARLGQKVVVLDPGLSFGTGQHPTTRFCLEQLAAHRKTATTQSLLDVGTGSGILAIAAAKLGYAPVDAFDIDPEAVRIARGNARRNRVSEKVRIIRADLATMSRRAHHQYSLICANLIYPLLISEVRRLIARLQPDGTLVVAGILAREFSELQKALERIGLRRTARRAEGEWCSGAFQFAD